MRGFLGVAFACFAGCGSFGCGDSKADAQQATKPDGAAGSSKYAAAVLADNPVAYWRMNLSASGVANMVSAGPSLVLDQGGGVSAVPTGALGNETDGAVRFDGSGGLKAADPAPFDFMGNTAFTVECWVEVSANQGGIIFGKAVPTTDSTRIDGYLASMYMGTLGFSYGAVDGNVSAQSALVATGWRHMAIVVDTLPAIQGTGNITLFIDAVKIVSAGLPEHPTAKPMQPFTVGAAPAIKALVQFTGTIDELAIYDHTLTPERLQAHIAASK
jgi:hypothetical protein